jgi:hypothetical protein
VCLPQTTSSLTRLDRGIWTAGCVVDCNRGTLAAASARASSPPLKTTCSDERCSLEKVVTRKWLHRPSTRLNNSPAEPCLCDFRLKGQRYATNFSSTYNAGTNKKKRPTITHDIAFIAAFRAKMPMNGDVWSMHIPTALSCHQQRLGHLSAKQRQA